MMGGSPMRGKTWGIALLLLGAGLALMVAGGLNNEFTAILLNAKILCLSCIGVQ